MRLKKGVNRVQRRDGIPCVALVIPLLWCICLGIHMISLDFLILRLIAVLTQCTHVFKDDLILKRRGKSMYEWSEGEEVRRDSYLRGHK